ELKTKGANVGVMLFQGPDTEVIPFVRAAFNLYQNKQAPLLHAVLCLDRFPDPPGVANLVPGIPTQIITVGHKGKNVGVLGMFRNPKNLQMRYALVPIGPQFQPKEGDEKKNPVLAVMQKYADELKAKDYLAKQPRALHPTQVADANAHYVGSE